MSEDPKLPQPVWLACYACGQTGWQGTKPFKQPCFLCNGLGWNLGTNPYWRPEPIDFDKPHTPMKLPG